MSSAHEYHWISATSIGLGQFAGAVLGTVIRNNDFEVGPRLSQNTFNSAAEKFFIVVVRDKDRYFRMQTEQRKMHVKVSRFRERNGVLRDHVGYRSSDEIGASRSKWSLYENRFEARQRLCWVEECRSILDRPSASYLRIPQAKSKKQPVLHSRPSCAVLHRSIGGAAQARSRPSDSAARLKSQFLRRPANRRFRSMRARSMEDLLLPPRTPRTKRFHKLREARMHQHSINKGAHP